MSSSLESPVGRRRKNKKENENRVMQYIKDLEKPTVSNLIAEWNRIAKKDAEIYEEEFNLTETGIQKQGMYDILHRLEKQGLVEKNNREYHQTSKYQSEIKFQGIVFADKAINKLLGSAALLQPYTFKQFADQIGALITYIMLQALRPSKTKSTKLTESWINESISPNYMFNVFKDCLPPVNMAYNLDVTIQKNQFPLNKQSFDKLVEKYKSTFPETFEILENIKSELTTSTMSFKEKIKDPRSVRYEHDGCDNEVLVFDFFEFDFIEDNNKTYYRCPKV